MQKLMLARGNSEYAFRIIDRAEVPRAPSKPRVTLIVVVATVFGGMLSVFVVLDPGHGQEPHACGGSDGGSPFRRLVLTPMKQPLMSGAESFIGSAINDGRRV